MFDGQETAALFSSFWSHLRTTFPDSLLVYNTGRSVVDVLNLLGENPLPTPDFIIGGVGTDIYDHVGTRIVSEWHETLSAGWNADGVRCLIHSQINDIEAQPDECQSAFKSSWFWVEKNSGDIRWLEGLLRDSGLEAQVVYSSGRDLDILPKGANKGNALSWLADREGVPLHRIAVAGDSGNDASMFLVEGVFGVIVSNAEESLLRSATGRTVYLAGQPCARGVIEGLTHHLNLSPPNL